MKHKEVVKVKYIKPATWDDINIGRMHSKSLVTQIIDEFLKSSLEIAEVETKDFKNSKYLYSNILRRIEKYNLPLRVVMRQRRVFLIKIKKT
jgi:hypothetical protein